ncbi:PopZ family protein [Nitratireductor sp. XY-223]|uniref:PopZ family protein n=1 Tax=Nitratireductor sp. XY-223 TaxID=2561926 RepID=UPI0010AAFC74|nr:PopZ family protein [Nitratireductor sp. XY-223]
MEEILASIRKIIEDNDDPESTEAASAAAAAMKTGETDSGDQPEPPVAVIKAANEAKKREPAQAAPAASDTALHGQAGSTGARPTDEKKATAPRGLPGDPGRSTKSSAAPQARPVSLAHLAAQVEREAESDDEFGGGKPANDPPAVEVLPTARKHAGAAEKKTGAGKGQEPMTTQSDTSLLDARDSRALISQEAGDKVAASFDNLSHAVVNGPSRSFDEIAEDMLRPMLQQWLDDNLPTLVERLVREEIERVARGR